MKFPTGAVLGIGAIGAIGIGFYYVYEKYLKGLSFGTPSVSVQQPTQGQSYIPPTDISPPPSNAPPGQYPIYAKPIENVPTIIPGVSMTPTYKAPPYTPQEFLTVAQTVNPKLPPTEWLKGTSGGSLTVIGGGTGKDVSSLLTVRGKALTEKLRNMNEVYVGAINTTAGGTREIAGSKALFERLAKNIGVQ